ncbi:hypothetical protein [Pectobacterium brasiliense]|uniref:hypothetical protein n=1 Tax=Pectobacterium brasiliense TaxID=180957 RepID=UPI00227B961B|nr:hypothetical protein [Pectobacterium brasiliense]WGL28621.1 hypothetical protein OWC53_03235 [Pectobacterium brasiliense]WJM79164.1 hypothetical protein QTI90_12580 [Pectobacterium brasiliense]
MSRSHSNGNISLPVDRIKSAKDDLAHRMLNNGVLGKRTLDFFQSMIYYDYKHCFVLYDSLIAFVKSTAIIEIDKEISRIIDDIDIGAKINVNGEFIDVNVPDCLNRLIKFRCGFLPFSLDEYGIDTLCVCTHLKLYTSNIHREKYHSILFVLKNKILEEEYLSVYREMLFNELRNRKRKKIDIENYVMPNPPKKRGPRNPHYQEAVGIADSTLKRYGNNISTNALAIKIREYFVSNGYKQVPSIQILKIWIDNNREPAGYYQRDEINLVF